MVLDIDERLVAVLVAEQFPAWTGLPVVAVCEQGWDNRTFRLGDDLSVRLPSAEAYVAAIAKENTVLPLVAAGLEVAVPEPVATGAPGCGYPFPWSVRRWLPGQAANGDITVGDETLARDLARFLHVLRGLPTTDAGPVAGRHSLWRGCHPGVYGEQVETALRLLGERVDEARARQIWSDATSSAWSSEPVWFHGDIAPSNLLVDHGRLTGVIAFGCCGLGDPACDLVMAWTHFTGSARRTFRDAAGLDADTWRRARGWALWKALVTLAGMSSSDRTDRRERVLADVLAGP